MIKVTVYIKHMPITHWYYRYQYWPNRHNPLSESEVN